MESCNTIYKKMQILKLEDVVLQNNCLFVYDQLQKCLLTTFDSYFHKATDRHGHNTRGKKRSVPITKTSTYRLQSIISSLIRDLNNLNSKTSIDLASRDLSRIKLIKGIRQHYFNKH